MVQRVQYLILDDLDGSEGAETVIFSLDGVVYEVDLTKEHAEELRRGLEPWIKAGRRAKGAKPAARAGRAAKPAKEATGDTAKIRTWALEQGMEVADRGRIPREVRRAYEAAH
ncbi:MAG: Lsr2 family protein [Bifidobacteriaceae bacterium]|jgi:hypothetical protein|nr:Lsr2 family protein [Bifidobacteriaceae bacterium]